MTLAIFDLDNTLLAGDSDHRWGEFVCDKGLVDSEGFSAQNDAFYRAYCEGGLDIHAYLRFALGPLRGMTTAQVGELQAEFLAHWVEPMVLPEALELIERHREQGDRLIIITATNSAVTAPIARRLGVSTLLACDAEIVDDRYTGDSVGVPTFQEGKVLRLKAWLETHGESLSGAWFYSDSHNDLPLLRAVDNPVAVDPDERLAEAASAAGWPIISLRGT